MPLLRGDLLDHRARVDVGPDQQPPAAGCARVREHRACPGAGAAVGRPQQRTQLPLRRCGHWPRPDRQPRCRHAWRRREARRADRPGQSHLVTGGPPGGFGIARAGARQPPGGAVLDDQLGGGEPDPRIAEQATAQPGRERERRAGHDQEFPARQLHLAQVRLDHADPRVVVEAPPQPGCQARIPFHGDDPGPGLGEPGRDRATAGSEVEHELAVTGASRADELDDQRAVMQEVGTGWVRCWWSPGHGGP